MENGSGSRKPGVQKRRASSEALVFGTQGGAGLMPTVRTAAASLHMGMPSAPQKFCLSPGKGPT